MTSYLVVLQTGANEFKCMAFKAETPERTYSQYRQHGIGIAIFEENEHSKQYVENLIKDLQK